MKRNRNNSLLDRAAAPEPPRIVHQTRPPQNGPQPDHKTVEAVTFVMLALLIYIAVTGDASQGSLLYNFIVFVVLLAYAPSFANFAGFIAEAWVGRRADSLRKDPRGDACKRIEPGRPVASSAARPPAATSFEASRATRSPPTARSSRDSPRSTKAPSRANRPR